MHTVSPLRIELAPSRTTLHFLGVAAATTCVAVLTLPWPPLVQAAALSTIVVWAADRGCIVALRRGSRAVHAIVVTEGRRIRVIYGDGSIRDGRVGPATCVTSFLTTLVWHEDGSRLSRSLLILPDMLAADDFRRLRVLVRYGRSELTHGAPASHA